MVGSTYQKDFERLPEVLDSLEIDLGRRSKVESRLQTDLNQFMTTTSWARRTYPLQANFIYFLVQVTFFDFDDLTNIKLRQGSITGIIRVQVGCDVLEIFFCGQQQLLRPEHGQTYDSDGHRPEIH